MLHRAGSWTPQWDRKRLRFEIFQDEPKLASLEFALDLIGEDASYTAPFDCGGDSGLGLGD